MVLRHAVAALLVSAVVSPALATDVYRVDGHACRVDGEQVEAQDFVIDETAGLKITQSDYSDIQVICPVPTGELWAPDLNSVVSVQVHYFASNGGGDDLDTALVAHDYADDDFDTCDTNTTLDPTGYFSESLVIGTCEDGTSQDDWALNVRVLWDDNGTTLDYFRIKRIEVHS